MSAVILSATAPTIGATITNPAQTTRKGNVSFIANGLTTSGTGLASGKIQGSHDGVAWVDLLFWSISLSVTAATDGGGVTNYYPYLRATCDAISGTGAAVTITVDG